MEATPRSQTTTRTVTDQYGNEHRLHINEETGGTHHKHSAEWDDACPYCNDSIDYGMGIQL